jgi:hypothetical protein
MSTALIMTRTRKRLMGKRGISGDWNHHGTIGLRTASTSKGVMGKHGILSGDWNHHDMIEDGVFSSLYLVAIATT